MLLTTPSGRQVITVVGLLSTLLLILTFFTHGEVYQDAIAKIPNPLSKSGPEKPHNKPVKHPKYKPVPTYIPPPIKDNFPLLQHSKPPPIPKWNVPKSTTLHRDYDLPLAPPLLIGFTRSWPILLQAVVSYITAGWPADQIFVVENTGVQQANARGQLTLQNPFYLNHTILRTLGVNIIQTPTLLTFAQLQNFYLSLTYTKNWPYYFWSHMDVLTLSFEDGNEHTPKYSDKNYKPIYTLALEALQKARRDPHWGTRWFSYDHLALVNPLAYEDVGGWDTMIPYYITDCDMHARLAMRNWTMLDAKAAIITDVSTTIDDLLALYRVDGVEAKFTDPNPPPPPPPAGKGAAVRAARRGDEKDDDENLRRWRKLQRTAETMFHYKHGDRGRNTWQLGQHGGQGEPFYYNSKGFAEAIDVTTESGKEVFRRKWGHRDCDLREGAGLGFGDQWMVEKDF